MADTYNPNAVGAAPYEKRWLAMAILLFAMFMNMIDVTIVNVAIPSLKTGLQSSDSAVEWVIAGYSLAFSLGLMPFGRYGDIIGRKTMFLVGVTCFTIASTLCGLAPNMEIRIVARVVQGAAAAVMMPQVLSLAQVMFPPKERAGAFALFGLTAGLASVAGPLVGGLLIEANIYGSGWRPIFLINIPIGIITVFAGRALIPTVNGNPLLKNDWIGILIAAVAIFCVIFPLIEGRGYGWPVWCFVMIGLFFILAYAFYLWENAQKARGAAELLPVSLMKNSNYMIGAFGTMVFFSAMPGFFLILAVFLQSGYGLSPLHSGLTTVPFPVGVLIASIVSGRLGIRFQRQRILAGAFILIAVMLMLRHVISGVGDAIVSTDFILPLFFGGFGTGMAISPMFQVVLAAVPGKDAGAGSGALQAVQQMGGAFGVAIVSEIYFSTIAFQMQSGAVVHEAYKTAFMSAVWYNISCYIVVALTVSLLKATVPSSGAPHGAAPPPPVE